MMHTESVILDSDQGAIMASLEPGLENVTSNSVGFKGSHVPQPLQLSTELQSLNLLADHENNRLSFLVLDGQDNLSTSNFEEFSSKLGCDPSSLAKVVAIVGNAGDGKSYALNQIFFPELILESEEVFATSSSSDDSCTSGIWAAFEPHMPCLVLDTEGMLGVNSKDGVNGANENRRTRQLLKILAISDIVIYKTRYVCSRFIMCGNYIKITDTYVHILYAIE